MTLTHTVDIPADRRVRFDFEVPREVPTGRTDVVMQFPVKEEAEVSQEEHPKIHIPVNSEGKFILTKEIIDELLQDPLLKRITGILHTDMTLDEIRKARLAKHL
jgi:hypothetical protein